MIIRKHSGAPSLNSIEGNIADAELDIVSGGDKKTTTPKPTTTPVKYMTYTLENTMVSSY